MTRCGDLEYREGDELDDWRTPALVNGTTGTDFSTGWDFHVQVLETRTGNALVDKTTGITGGVDEITTAWDAGELVVLEPGRYPVFLRATRTSDDRDFTLSDVIRILPGLDPTP